MAQIIPAQRFVQPFVQQGIEPDLLFSDD